MRQYRETINAESAFEVSLYEEQREQWGALRASVHRQFARNFANNSVRIVSGITSLASKWERRRRAMTLRRSRNRRWHAKRVSHNGLRSETASITGQQSGAWINREANSAFVHLDLARPSSREFNDKINGTCASVTFYYRLNQATRIAH